MRLLGVDYGQKRAGLAINVGEVVLPLVTLKVSNDLTLARELGKICQEQRIDRIVLGLPVRLDGSYSATTKKVLRFGKLLSGVSHLPVVYSEEQLTTKAAGEILREAGLEKRRGLRDQAAAALILKDYLGSI